MATVSATQWMGLGLASEAQGIPPAVEEGATQRVADLDAIASSTAVPLQINAPLLSAEVDAASTAPAQPLSESLLAFGDGDVLSGAGGVLDAGEELLDWEEGEYGMPEAPEMALMRLSGANSGALDLSDLLQDEEMSNLNGYLEAATGVVKGEGSTVLHNTPTTQSGADVVAGHRKAVLEGQGVDTLDQTKLVQDLISQGKFSVDL